MTTEAAEPLRKSAGSRSRGSCLDPLTRETVDLVVVNPEAVSKKASTKDGRSR